ncbi:MAG: hypothetical protein JSW11_02785 [Candidatus Heimdallarchaeota archaeon]|nr:MAG: hypothetical protein JSW11_02785 [Candidatus Heimdallarchaeota archaeon]
MIAEDIFEFEGILICIFCGNKLTENRKWVTRPNKSILCSEICLRKHKAKRVSELNHRTGVTLQKTREIDKEWGSRDPFRGVAPPEITFNHSEDTNDISFEWKIAIPDILDVFYWPLQKKMMIELLLNYSKLNNENNKGKEAS